MSERLLLLHGFTGSPASWDDVVAHLDPAYDVLVPALGGHDPEVFADHEPWTDTSDHSQTFGEEAFGLFAALYNEPESEPIHIAGYSLGARLALAMITTAPERFLSATLIGVNPGLRSDAERAARRAADARWIELLEAGIEPFVAEWERQSLWASQARLPEATRAAQRAARLRHHPRGLQASLRATGLAEMPDLRPRLPGVRLPVTLLAGEEDPKFLALAEETAALLPDARVVVVPDAGHNLLLERPQAVADELNRNIR